MSRHGARLPRGPRFRAVVAAALGGVLAFVGALAGAAPARAGGSWLDPVADRYDAGDVATLVGYVGRGPLGWVDDGPFFAYLRAGDVGSLAQPGFSDQGLPVGRLEVDPLGGPDASVLRVSLALRLPSTLPPGSYGVAYCNDPCTTGLGDLVGGRLSVGVDPPTPFVRAWPPDEPEVADLAPDALLAEPGFVATAEQVRTGTVPAPTTVAPAPPQPPTPAPVPTVAPVPTAPTVAATVPPAPTVRLPVPPAVPPVVSRPAVSRPAVSRPATAGHSYDGWLLVLGASLALVCTLSVLLALGAGRPVPRRDDPGAPAEVRAVERVPVGRR
jgi:hypothetical protein